MLDKTIPHMGVLMVLEQAAKYPIYSLPDGYTFELYQDGYENSWAKMQYINGQIDSFEEAQMCFDNEFKSRINEVRQNMFFVKSPSGQLVATASIWDGKHFGETKPRIHWVSVNADQQGKGLAKALMTRVMDRHLEMEQGNFLYLTSQTWSYKALNIYREFGFIPYKGEKPVGWKGSKDAFEYETKTAWAIIEEKICSYKNNKCIQP